MLIIFISVSPSVAFHAWLSHWVPKKGETIKYNQVTTNIGNGYNSNTGKFVAPVSGVYMFAATVTGRKGFAHLDIIKNYHRVGNVRSEETKDLDSGTKVIVLKLNASDAVYLRHEVGGSHDLFTYMNYGFNTFSGFLIKRIIT